MRLRRSDVSGPGISRKRSGKGFTYTEPDGKRLEDADALARIKDLVPW